MVRRVLLVMQTVISGIVLGILFCSPAFAARISHKVCVDNPSPGWTRCLASIETSDGITPLASKGPIGFSPAVFSAAYGNHATGAMKVAVVGAYDAPNIQQDVATFSRTFGLAALPSCTANSQLSCFSKLDQRGGYQYPAINSSWAVEISMDVETIHGMCPGCRITLVEAMNPSIQNVTAAVDTAVQTGATVVSNSYGGPESSEELQYDGHYRQSGVTMVVSSGDGGYGTSYPAASPGVVAVGGTHLRMNATKTQVLSETAWKDGGSGCSQFEPKPSWQTDTGCPRRSIADVSADADPATGAAIYDSYPSSGHAGWFTVGGTSLAAPIVAGIIAGSGNAANQPAYLYGHASTVLRDIVGGRNGTCAKSIGYFCKTAAGYDGPTGLGVLNNF
jgi:subtilase family serine protease